MSKTGGSRCSRTPSFGVFSSIVFEVTAIILVRIVTYILYNTAAVLKLLWSTAAKDSRVKVDRWLNV